MTERDVVLRERAAAAKAIEWVCARARRDYGINSGIDGLDTRRYVEETFPLPKVTRRRAVTDPHDAGVQWTVTAASDPMGLCYRHAGNPWAAYPAMVGGWKVPEPSLLRCKLWAELLENPNETVEL